VVVDGIAVVVVVVVEVVDVVVVGFCVVDVVVVGGIESRGGQSLIEVASAASIPGSWSNPLTLK